MVPCERMDVGVPGEGSESTVVIRVTGGRDPYSCGVPGRSSGDAGFGGQEADLGLFLGGVPGGSGALWHFVPPSSPPGRTPPAPSCSQPCRSCCAWQGRLQGGCPCWTQWEPCSCGTPLPWRQLPVPEAWGRPWGGFAVCTAPAFPSWYGVKGAGHFGAPLVSFGVVWGTFGLVFGILRCHLGVIWGVLCYLGTDLGHWGHLGAVWGSFGVISVRFDQFWGRLGLWVHLTLLVCILGLCSPLFVAISSTVAVCPQYSQFAARRRLQAQVEQLQYQLSDRSLLLLPEYRQRLGVSVPRVPPG